MQTNSSSSKVSKREKKTFSREEDNLINFVVTTFGNRNWEMIATFVKGRTAKQCRDRYMNYLKPGLTNIEWTQSEDDLIIELYMKYGPKWAIISKYFANRNQISIKNRFKFLQKSRANDKAKSCISAEKKNSNLFATNDDIETIVSDVGPQYPDLDEFEENIIDVQNDASIFNYDNDFEFEEPFSTFSYF
ncbi:hypothetical protein M9Y10_044587 [Tritrichomonas musculus]|uniref:Myb-like DNA-binding domain containing protein n=1 Tax=Tritrichomonas musculus TaxID=1915356 RepID=A0ABR2JT78_9EUKA